MYNTTTSSRPQSYAPTPYGYTPNTSFSARISLDEEVKVADSTNERDVIDSLAEIYSIIRTLDGLEKAYIKDALTESERTEMCSKLLKQYKSILSDENVENEFVDLDTFCATWDIECRRATELIRKGFVDNPSAPPPGNGQQSHGTGGGGAAGSLILAATENFITFLDALRLNYISKAALHPLLSEVIQSVNKVTDRDFEHRAKIIQWLITLNQMKTSEELDEEQARDLAFDMEQAYNGFKATIQ